MTGKDRRSSRSDFKPLPGGNRSCEAVMRGDPPETIWILMLQRRRAIGNPDAFAIETYYPGQRVAGSFLRPSAGKERPVQHGQLRMPRRVVNRDRKETGILVVLIPPLPAEHR